MSPWRGGDVHIVPLRQIGNIFWENVVDAEKYIIYINNVSKQVDELKPVNVVLSKNILGRTRHQSWFPEYTLIAKKNIKTNILKTHAALQEYSQDLFMSKLNYLLSGAGSTWEVIPRMFGDEWVLVQVIVLLIMIMIIIESRYISLFLIIGQIINID